VDDRPSKGIGKRLLKGKKEREDHQKEKKKGKKLRKQEGKIKKFSEHFQHKKGPDRNISSKNY